MEALNKESKFAAPVLTWAQKRSDLREKSTLGKFVNSLQGLNHEDVLLKLETKIINNMAKVMHVHPLTGFVNHGNNAAWFPVLYVI